MLAKGDSRGVPDPLPTKMGSCVNHTHGAGKGGQALHLQAGGESSPQEDEDTGTGRKPVA